MDLIMFFSINGLNVLTSGMKLEKVPVQILFRLNELWSAFGFRIVIDSLTDWREIYSEIKISGGAT